MLYLVERWEEERARARRVEEKRSVEIAELVELEMDHCYGGATLARRVDVHAAVADLAEPGQRRGRACRGGNAELRSPVPGGLLEASSRDLQGYVAIIQKAMSSQRVSSRLGCTCIRDRGNAQISNTLRVALARK